MVGVTEGLLGDSPGVLPGEFLLIHQNSHQLDDRQSRMCVVQLDCDLGGKFPERTVILLESADDVADGTGYQKVLLNQAQFLAGNYGIGGIEHLGDSFGLDLLLDGFEIVAVIKDPHVEVAGRARRVKAEEMDCPPAVTRNEHVVGQADESFPVHPHGIVDTVPVDPMLDAAIDRDHAGFIRAGNLPGSALREPVVRPIRAGSHYRSPA